MAFIDTLVVFAISLLVGAIGIYIGARIITDVGSFTYAIITALIASLVWAIVALFLGWIPFLGPLLGLLAYLWVINWRYPGGWVTASAIALIAWLASLIIMFLLSLLGIIPPDAVGIVGT